MSIDDDIRACFEAGQFDPAVISQTITERRTRKELAAALLDISDWTIRQRSRTLIGTARRVVAASDEASELEPLVIRAGKQIWIPEVGYKAEADCSSADLRSAADYHRRLAGSHLQTAKKLEKLADQVDAAGVATVADLPARAKPGAKPRSASPARAKVASKPTVQAPARAARTKVAAR